MAKIAKCGQGSQGQGLGKTENGYTYVVNDNVRTKDVIQVISTNWKSGKKFATTAMARSVFKDNSVKGREAKIEGMTKSGKDLTQALDAFEKKGDYSMKDIEKSGQKLTQAYGLKEMGLSRKDLKPSEYKDIIRAGNIAKYKEQNPDAVFSKNAQETFDSYSKKFMKKENN